MSLRYRILPLFALALAACESPSGSTPTPEPVVPRRGSVQISPDSVRFNSLHGATVVNATVRDSAGKMVGPTSLTWSLLDAPVVSVGASGLLESRENGRARLVARAILPDSSVVADTIPVVVRQVVAGIAVGSGRRGLYLGDTARVAAVAYDSLRWPVKDVAFTWRSEMPGVVQVDASGGIRAMTAGVSRITASTPSFAGSAVAIGAVEVAVLAEGSFTQVRSGASQSCGLVKTGDVYCWGQESGAMLSDGTRILNAVPTRVETAEKFASVDVGQFHACGLTASGAAFCWGGNLFGQLGNNARGTDSPTPQPVSPGTSFTVIATGNTHTCALAASGEAYCWGSNDFGELGSGNPISGTYNAQPTRVTGGIRFVTISAGDRHTCGISDQGATYCWGGNSGMKLGTNSTSFVNVTPTRVAEGYSFASIYALGNHTCGVTAQKQVYCWGGWVDVSATYAVSSRTVPTRVGAAIEFASMGDGLDQMCGVAKDGSAYCWSAGDASPLVRVPGGVSFTSVSPGRDRSCALGTDQKIYCWGPGGVGGMGDGVTQSSTAPVKVAAPY